MPLDLSVVSGDEVATDVNDGNMRRPGTEILRFLVTWLLIAEIQIRRIFGSCSTIPGSTISGWVIQADITLIILAAYRTGSITIANPTISVSARSSSTRSYMLLVRERDRWIDYGL
jgi:hypothetical protein